VLGQFMQGRGGVLGISVADFPFTACKGISLGVTWEVVRMDFLRTEQETCVAIVWHSVSYNAVKLIGR
jgi:hypothetical protein